MICDMIKTIEANHHVQTITSGLIWVREGCKHIETTVYKKKWKEIRKVY